MDLHNHSPTCYTLHALWTSVIFHFPNNTMSANLNDMAMPNTAGNRSDTMWWALKTKYLLACDTESCRDDNSYSLPVISKLLICRCLVPSDLIGIIRNMVINYSVLSGRLHSGYSWCHNSSFTAYEWSVYQCFSCYKCVSPNKAIIESVNGLMPLSELALA